MSDNGKGFEEWAVLELMGHQQIAGLLSEQEIAGHAFLRVDVPALKTAGGIELAGYTKYFGTGSVYAIHPCSEELARKAAEQLHGRRAPLPVHIPDLADADETIRKAERARRQLLAAGAPPSDAAALPDYGDAPPDGDDDDWDESLPPELAG